jgi:hypothetical protein
VSATAGKVFVTFSTRSSLSLILTVRREGFRIELRDSHAAAGETIEFWPVFLACNIERSKRGVERLSRRATGVRAPLNLNSVAPTFRSPHNVRRHLRRFIRSAYAKHRKPLDADTKAV